MRERPVNEKEFKAVLASIGFAPRAKTGGGTSHEQWIRHDAHGFFRVTVDSHHAPFHRDLLRLMLRQAGLSKAEFFALLEAL